jgi:alkanesulfonate monooxygenase SsuD/methylene tetrahydromethanopterin reductase-like flavin-dependent oxidoreductase (luciferase family)
MEVAVQSRGSYSHLTEIASWAEAEGLAAIALPDHYLAGEDESEPAYDNLVHLAGLARDTATIELVDLVSPVTFRHPAVYAKTAVTLAEMAPGRLAFGLGTGWLEKEHRLFGFEFPSQAVRFRMLEESLAYVCALVAGEGFEGEYFRLQAFESRPRPDFRLVVGGSGATKTPRLAGRYAGEFNLFPARDDDLSLRVDGCRRAATEAGRDPTRLLMSYTTPAFAGTDQASYRRLIEAEAAQRSIEPHDLERRLERRSIPFGFGEDLDRRLEHLAGAGVTRIYLQVMGRGPKEIASLIAPYRR